MTVLELSMEIIGWLSTVAFLFSIVVPQRVRLHQWGVFTSVTTGVYAFYHGATAIWVKWVIALFFHVYMMWKLRRETRPTNTATSTLIPKPAPDQNQHPDQD